MAVMRKEPYDPAANQYPKMVYLGEVKAGKGTLVQNKEEHDALLAKQVPVEPVKAEPEKVVVSGMVDVSDDKHALVATATSLGIEVDKRWGVERLKTEIAAKSKA